MLHADMADWVERWKAAGPRLEAIRMAEIERTELAQFIGTMDDAFESARSVPAAQTSGLVIQQRLFARMAG
jgi:hypothetical protein